MIKLRKRKRRSTRGLSPIVAQILLIGLVVVAGSITFTTVYVAMTTKDPITLSIRKVSDFSLSNSSTVSTKYDTFAVLVENSGTRAVGILSTGFKLYNSSTDTLLSNWEMESGQFINSLQSLNIQINSNSSLENDWLSFNESIRIEFFIYALDDEYQQADKLQVSNEFIISNEAVAIGPLQLITNSSTPTSPYAVVNITDTSNDTIELAVENYGSLEVEYGLDFIVSNRTLNLSIAYLGNTTLESHYITGTLSPATGNTPSTSNILTVTVQNKSPVSPGREFYVTVWLKVDSSIYDTLLIVCTT